MESCTEVDSGVRQTEVVSGLPLSSVHPLRAAPKWIPVGGGPSRFGPPLGSVRSAECRTEVVSGGRRTDAALASSGELHRSGFRFAPDRSGFRSAPELRAYSEGHAEVDSGGRRTDAALASSGEPQPASSTSPSPDAGSALTLL